MHNMNKDKHSDKKQYPESTYMSKNSKAIRILGFGYRELKFFIILSWIIKYCITHHINPKAASRLNPGIPRGGKGLASKNYTNTYLTLKNPIAKKYLAKYTFIPANKSYSEMKDEFKKFKNKPVVLKPDQGARSIGVIITTTDSERMKLFNVRKNMNYIAQEYVDYQHELGVFYYRYPSWKKGKILGIAEKIFRIISGDGKNSLQELLKDIKLTKAIQTQMEFKFHSLKYIPSSGEKIMLTNTVDHYDEGEYYDRSDLITPDVEKVFNKIIGDKKFYFCRFDIRAKNLKDFSKGKNFKILELNTGPNVVLLHSFDPRYTKKKQLQIYFKGFTHAFKIAEKSKSTEKENMISYLWFLMKDEIPLFFLKNRIKHINKN